MEFVLEPLYKILSQVGHVMPVDVIFEIHNISFLTSPTYSLGGGGCGHISAQGSGRAGDPPVQRGAEAEHQTVAAAGL